MKDGAAEGPLAGASPAVLLRGAVAGGLGGAAALSTFLLLLRATGVSSLDLERMLGSALTRSLDGTAWLVGFGVHLSFGVLFALVYGSILRASRREGPVAGAALGVLHAVVDGAALPVLMGAHPLVVAGALVNPGFYARNIGLPEVLIFVLGHVLYGAVVGALVRPHPVLPASSDAGTVPREELVGRR